VQRSVVRTCSEKPDRCSGNAQRLPCSVAARAGTEEKVKIKLTTRNTSIKHHVVSLQRMNKTVALHTLGCKLNFSETSSIGRLLENDGFVKKEFSENADVYVINTCSVTNNADKECRLLVRRIQKKAPGALVVITGCYAQLKPVEIASIPGVDLVLGAAEKFNIIQ